VSMGLLGAVLGCKTHGVCDCNVHPIGSGTPCGAAHPGNPMPPPAGVPGIIPTGADLKPVPAN